MHYLLKNNLYHKAKRGLFKIWANFTNCWLTQVSKKQGYIPSRALTRHPRRSQGEGDRAASPGRKLDFDLLITALGSSSSKPACLEGSRSEEFLIAAAPK